MNPNLSSNQKNGPVLHRGFPPSLVRRAPSLETRESSIRSQNGALQGLYDLGDGSVLKGGHCWGLVVFSQKGGWVRFDDSIYFKVSSRGILLLILRKFAEAHFRGY